MTSGVAYSKGIVSAGLATAIITIAVWAWSLSGVSRDKRAADDARQMAESTDAEITAETGEASTAKLDSEKAKAAAFKSRFVDSTKWAALIKSATDNEAKSPVQADAGIWATSLSPVTDGESKAGTDYQKRHATLRLLSNGIADWPKVLRLVDAVEARKDEMGVSAIEIKTTEEEGHRVFETVLVDVEFYAQKDVDIFTVKK